MLQKVFLFLFSISVCIPQYIRPCACTQPSNNQPTTTTKIVVYSTLVTVIVTGAIIARSITLPDETLETIRTATGPLKKMNNVLHSLVVPKTAIGKVSLALEIAQLAKPYVMPSTEKRLNKLLQNKSKEASLNKDMLISCLVKNKDQALKDSPHIPSACQDVALFYAFAAGNEELNKRIEAFNNGECFCFQ